MILPTSNSISSQARLLIGLLLLAIFAIVVYLASNVSLSKTSNTTNTKQASHSATAAQTATVSAPPASKTTNPPVSSAFYGGVVTGIDYTNQTFSLKEASSGTTYKFVLAKDAVVNKVTGKGDFSAIKVGTNVFVFSQTGAKSNKNSTITANTVSY